MINLLLPVTGNLQKIYYRKSLIKNGIECYYFLHNSTVQKFSLRSKKMKFSSKNESFLQICKSDGDFSLTEGGRNCPPPPSPRSKFFSFWKKTTANLQKKKNLMFFLAGERVDLLLFSTKLLFFCSTKIIETFFSKNNSKSSSKKFLSAKKTTMKVFLVRIYYLFFFVSKNIFWRKKKSTKKWLKCFFGQKRPKVVPLPAGFYPSLPRFIPPIPPPR